MLKEADEAIANKSYEMADKGAKEVYVETVRESEVEANEELLEEEYDFE